MSTVCSEGIRVPSLIQSILTFQNFMAGDRDNLLVEVERSRFQCVLKDPRVLGYCAVFKGPGCPKYVRMYFLALSNLKKQSTAYIRVS